MRKMENLTYKRWKKMWRLWKYHKLDSPLEELVTYDNYMTHGHLCYFQHLKDDATIKRHMFVLKDFLSREFYENLEKAYKIYVDNKSKISSKKVSEFELEEMFMEVDEWYYDDSYEVLKLIMFELQEYCKIKINNLRERRKVLIKFYKNNRNLSK